MPAAPHPIAISDVVQETAIDRTIVLPVPKRAEAEFRFVPGQFVTLIDPEDDVKPPRKKAYSISSSPLDAGRVEVTVRDMGSFGNRLYRFPVGKVLHVIAPRGKFTLDSESGVDLVLAAGGSGVTPYRSFVRFLRSNGRTAPVSILYSARVPEDLVFDAEFRGHARECPWLRYVPTVTRLAPDAAWEGERGRLSESLVRAHVRDVRSTLFYACGPDAFVDAALSLAAAVGIPPPHLKKEKWG